MFYTNRRMGQYVPLLFVTFLYISVFAYIIASTQIDTLREDWNARRCTLVGMLLASYIPNPNDPDVRPSKFSNENFQFCVSEFVDASIAAVMVPIMGMMSTQVNVAQTVNSSVNNLRFSSATDVLSPFNGLINVAWQKLQIVLAHILRIIYRLNSAYKRIFGIVISAIFAGVSVFTSISNFIKVLEKVVAMIMAIIIAIIFVLMFLMMFAFSFLAPVAGATAAGTQAAVIGANIAGTAARVGVMAARAIPTAVRLGTTAGRVAATGARAGRATGLDSTAGLAGVRAANANTQLGRYAVKPPNTAWKEFASDPTLLKKNPSNTLTTIMADSVPIPDFSSSDAGQDDSSETESSGQVFAAKSDPNSVSDSISNATSCVAAGTLVHCKRGLVPVEDCKAGDLLDEGAILGILEGEAGPCVSIHSVVITNTHIVYDEAKGWVFAKDHTHASPAPAPSRVYSLATTSRVWKVQMPGEEHILLRDWTHLSRDRKSDDLAEEFIHTLLQNKQNTSQNISQDIPFTKNPYINLLVPSSIVWKDSLPVSIYKIKIGDMIRDGDDVTRVTGVYSSIETGTGSYLTCTGERVRADNTGQLPLVHIITESGTFTLNHTRVRDFIEVGSDLQILEDFLLSLLNNRNG